MRRSCSLWITVLLTFVPFLVLPSGLWHPQALAAQGSSWLPQPAWPPEKGSLYGQGVHPGSLPPTWWPWPDRYQEITHTWLDAFNFLDLIPGPPFLLAFVLYAAFVILLCRTALTRLLIGLEQQEISASRRRLLTFLKKPSYLEAAYLRGGRKAVIEAAVCNLLRLGVLSLDLGGRKLSRVGQPHALTLLENAITSACSAGIEAYRVAGDSGVQAALHTFEGAARGKLMEVGLLPTRNARILWVLLSSLAILLVIGLGYVRLERSLMRGYSNVQFLFLLMFTGGIAAPPALYRRWSVSGSRYLTELRKHYGAIAQRAQAKFMDWMEPEVLYAIAVLGAGALGGDGLRRTASGDGAPAHAGGRRQ